MRSKAKRRLDESQRTGRTPDRSPIEFRLEKIEARGNKARKPAARKHKVSTALRAYAPMTTSAAKGAVRVVK